MAVNATTPGSPSGPNACASTCRAASSASPRRWYGRASRQPISTAGRKGAAKPGRFRAGAADERRDSGQLQRPEAEALPVQPHPIAAIRRGSRRSKVRRASSRLRHRRRAPQTHRDHHPASRAACMRTAGRRQDRYGKWHGLLLDPAPSRAGAPVPPARAGPTRARLQSIPFSLSTSLPPPMDSGSPRSPLVLPSGRRARPAGSRLARRADRCRRRDAARSDAFIDHGDAIRNMTLHGPKVTRCSG